MHAIGLVAVFLCALIANSAQAKNSGKLPKDAVPLTSAEVEALHSGNTLDLTISQILFKADKSISGLSRGRSYGDGKWSVIDNEMCLDSAWHGKDKSGQLVNVKYLVCWKFYKAKDVVWTQNSKGGEEKEAGDIYTGQDKKIKAGDQVSEKVVAFKLENGL